MRFLPDSFDCSFHDGLRRLSIELVDGTAALSLGEAFEGRNVELCLNLFRINSELACEIEQELDLLWTCGSIR